MKKLMVALVVVCLTFVLWPKVAGADTQGIPPTKAQCLAKVEPTLKAEFTAHPKPGYTLAEAISKLTATGAPCSGSPSNMESLITPSITSWAHSYYGEICSGPVSCYVPPSAYDVYFDTYWRAYAASSTTHIAVRNHGDPICTTHATLPLYSVTNTKCAWDSGYASGGSNPMIFARDIYTLTFGWGPAVVHFYYWYWQDDYWSGKTTFGCREC